MKPQRPQMSAVCLQALNHVCLLSHTRADVVYKENVVSKNFHVGAALKCARDVISQSPAVDEKCQ